ncbi:MAG: hypothetical protein Q8K59_13305 [Nitrosomonas sp.]|nr:hypothetical protein [Moraxellaceae bacterium]MDP1952033.1 hypothetical protein [Nitrosomonas sp.]
MQTLYQAQNYPDELRNLVVQSRIGIELANRWMLGWPDRVKVLIEAQEYHAAFEIQLEQEIEAEANAAQYGHLSSWEKREVLGMRESP